MSKWRVQAALSILLPYSCPAPAVGDQCQYRHALPPGFVLNSQRNKRDTSETRTITLEEFIEVEVSPLIFLPIAFYDRYSFQRHKLGPNLTPVTKESFTQWKQTRMEKKETELEAIRRVKNAQAVAGKSSGMSGRDLVSFLLSAGVITECLS